MKALCAISNVIGKYNKQDRIAAFGFGAQTPPKYELSHFFYMVKVSWIFRLIFFVIFAMIKITLFFLSIIFLWISEVIFFRMVILKMLMLMASMVF